MALRSWLWPALAAPLALALGGPASGDELDEHRQRTRVVGEQLAVEDLRNLLDKDDIPAATDVPPKKLSLALKEQIAKLRKTSGSILEPLERLERQLHPRYERASLEELAALDPERNEVRRELVSGLSRFTEELQRFNALKKTQQTAGLTALLGGGFKDNAAGQVREALTVAYFGEEMRNIRMKLRYQLSDDEDQYQKRRQYLLERRRWARIAAGSGALFVLLAGLGLRTWLRRRRRSGTRELAPGDLVGGHYRLDRELGRGGMGVVFEATDLTLRRRVAIKKLRPELQESAKDLDMFLAEARLVAALKHPHIVEIHAIVDDGPDLLLVFELVLGLPLHLALQRSGPMPLESALSLLRQVGSALDFAHANKVIHRDLKPANIMVSPQGSAKVMDFGLAYQASVTVARLTRTETWGTPPYMAPEQELGSVSRESDLYSLGVVAYETLTGKPPFPGPNFLAQKREKRFAPVSRVVPALGTRLDEVFSRALDPDPALRFHSAAELLDALTSPAARPAA